MEVIYGQLIDRALQSETFEHCPVTRSLLKYLYDNRNREISEYSIATEVLARRDDFDPKSDSYVRVQIARLRAKLREFTEKEGNASTLQIVLPRGAYKLEFADWPLTTVMRGKSSSAEHAHTFAEARETDLEIAQSTASTQSSLLKLVRFLSAVIGTLAILLISILIWLGTHTDWWRYSHSLSAGSLESHFPFSQDSFWGKFVQGGKPVRIVLPNPVFFYWNDPKRKESVQVRSMGINDFSELQNSPILRDLSQKYGYPPILSQEYLSIYDGLSAFKLAILLSQNGTNVNVSDGTQFPLESIDHENVILMGTVQTLSPYQKYLKNLTLSFTPVARVIENHDPITGKEIDFLPIKESNAREVTPQLLACVPTNDAGGRMLVIEGYKENALVSYIASREGQEELHRVQTANGGSPFFEAVIMSEIDGNTPLRSRITYYHSLPFQK